MRPVADWDEKDLLALIGAQEGLSLEFKRSAKLAKADEARDTLSKVASAFANSAGGILVFGVIEDKHVAIGLDDGVDPAVVTKEWIDQVLSMIVHPRIQGLLIKQIWLSGDHVGRVAYAIEVPAATTFAPHQTRDHKYYRRLNFECAPMEDYEVRDLLRRATTPDLFLDFSIGSTLVTKEVFEFDLNIAIGNRSLEPAHHRVVTLLLDRDLTLLHSDAFAGGPNGVVQIGDQTTQLYGLVQMAGPPTFFPIYREETFNLGRVRLKMARGDLVYPLAHKVSCPGFSTRGAHWINASGPRPTIQAITATFHLDDAPISQV
jgi:hypothetical protein